MKNTFHTIILALLSLLLSPNISFGQLYEVSIDQKIENSSLIVEGKVVEAKCFRTQNGDIYTANKIEVGSLLKGQFQNRFLTVTTWGGELDGEIQTWTHLLALEKGDYGLFFLEPTRAEPIQDSNFPESFDVYAGSQGFLAFKQTETKAWVATEPFHIYSNLETDLFASIARKTGQELTIVSESGREIRNGVRYHFTDITFNGSAVTFNVYVNSLIGNKKLYKSGIQVGYNPTFFGSNIATNGNLVLQNAGVSSSSIYSLSKSNVASNEVKIELLPVGSLSGLTEIGTTEQLLTKGQISIQNILADPSISYNVAAMQSMSKYHEGGVASVFDTVIVDGDWSPFGGFLAATIDSIRPLSLRAGTDDILTIYGHKFGATQNSSNVQFTNAYAGITNGVAWIQPLKTDYNLWSDTIIKVFVPSIGLGGDATQYAGTGKIRVKIGSSSAVSSSETIKVRLGADNRATADNGATELKRRKVQLVGDFGEDSGYTIYYNSNFKNLGGARSAFERALCTWIQSSNINFRVKEFANISSTYQPFACQIALTNTFPIGVGASIQAFTEKTYYAGCVDASNTVIRAGLKKFDMYFRQSSAWYVDENYDPTLPLSFWIANPDMESFALHELGHAQLLLHVNQASDVMHHLVGSPNRMLHSGDVEGGTYIRDLSTLNIPNCGISPIVPNNNCGLIGTEGIIPEVKIALFPNPTFENVTLQSETIIDALSISNSLGSAVKILKPNNKFVEVSMAGFPSGVYFFTVTTHHKTKTYKVEKP